MRTTLNIDDELIRRASDLTGENEKTALVHRGLEALIAQQSARRLAALGGSDRSAGKKNTQTTFLRKIVVLVDASVWVDHLRRGSRHLSAILENGLVACHPFIIGELACGRMKNRREVLSLMETLPSASTISHQELLFFIDQNRLAGRGAGFADLHLLASARLDELQLWTADRKLKRIADELRLVHVW